MRFWIALQAKVGCIEEKKLATHLERLYVGLIFGL
jgi:hypothetical protein